MENINELAEKRRFKRVDSILPLQYKNLKKIGEISKGTTCRNISEGGACFHSSEFVSLACRLVVEIALPNSPKPVKAISKVAWIRRVPSSDQYELGNHFLEITKEDRSHIIDFISNTLGPQP